MMKLWRQCALVALSMALAGVSVAGPIVDRVVANVNGHVLLQSDWEEEVALEALMSGRAADSYTAPENKAALDRLIDRELLREQVRPAQTASPSDVAGRIAEVRKLQPEWATEEGWHAALERYGLTQAAIEKRLSNEIQLMKLVERSPSAFDSDRSKSSRKLLSEPASPGGKEDGGECQALAGNVREDSDVTRGKENERTALRMAGQFTLRQPHSHARIQCGRRKPLSDPPSLPVRRRILRKLLLAFCLLSATVFALLAWM